MFISKACSAIGGAVLAVLVLAPTAGAQSSPGMEVVIQMRDGTRHIAREFGFELSPDAVSVAGKDYRRSDARIVCARELLGDAPKQCHKAFPSLPGTQDIVVYQNGKRTVGHIDGVDCTVPGCVFSQNGETRFWRDVNYVQLAPVAPAHR